MKSSRKHKKSLIYRLVELPTKTSKPRRFEINFPEKYEILLPSGADRNDSRIDVPKQESERFSPFFMKQRNMSKILKSHLSNWIYVLHIAPRGANDKFMNLSESRRQKFPHSVEGRRNVLITGRSLYIFSGRKERNSNDNSNFKSLLRLVLRISHCTNLHRQCSGEMR